MLGTHATFLIWSIYSRGQRDEACRPIHTLRCTAPRRTAAHRDPASLPQAAGGGDESGGTEQLRDAMLNDTPFEPDSDLPSSGTLILIYFSTKPQDEITFDVELDLSQACDERVMKG